MYRALIQHVIPIDSNKKKLKDEDTIEDENFRMASSSGVILTKDNLVKRNRYGSKKCVFCYHDETIKYLFFKCKFAASVWSVIQMSSRLYCRTSVSNIFGNWLHVIDHKYIILIRVGVLAIIWSLRLCTNGKIFNDKSSSIMQVLYRCTAILRSWSTLQRVEWRELFMEVCVRLEDTLRDIFPDMDSRMISGLSLHLFRRHMSYDISCISPCLPFICQSWILCLLCASQLCRGGCNT
jgi:hypothetical protein